METSSKTETYLHISDSEQHTETKEISNKSQQTPKTDDFCATWLILFIALFLFSIVNVIRSLKDRTY